MTVVVAVSETYSLFNCRAPASLSYGTTIHAPSYIPFAQAADCVCHPVPSATMAADQPSATEFLIRHTVLPPKLPRFNDTKPAREQMLLKCTIAALRDLQSNISGAEPVLAQRFDSPISVVASRLDSRNVEGHIAEEQLVKSRRHCIWKTIP
ncbi:hypothetical protein PMIN04_003612 [Paraphaeosphaeria minitans]